MLLGWAIFPLRIDRCQSLSEVLPGFRGLDYVIHQSTASGYIRIGKSRAVTFDKFLPPMLLIFRHIDFAAKDDLRSALRAHDCDFSRGPCHRPVGPQFLAAHRDISAAVGFA